MFHVSFDELSIDDHIVDAFRVVRIQPAGLRSVQDEEGAMANMTASWQVDLPAEQVGGQSRVRGRELWVSGPFDFEEPDRDPDRELVGPDRGQVQDALEPFGAKIRALPAVCRRARTQVSVL